MKTIFIPAKIRNAIDNKDTEEISKNLPKNIAIAYSIQYKEIAEKMKQSLSKNHKITLFTQVLGCSKPNFPGQTQAVLLVSSGRFHAVSLAFETSLPVYVLYNNSIQQISEQETEQFRKKQKTAYLKFLNSDKVGILVSAKPGQENLKKALELKKKLKKKSYIFIGNEINALEFENFPIKSWVNTACPRLDMESDSIVNMDRIE